MSQRVKRLQTADDIALQAVNRLERLRFLLSAAEPVTPASGIDRRGFSSGRPGTAPQPTFGEMMAGVRRVQRRRRLRAERKDAKPQARGTISVAADGTSLLQQEMFAHELPSLDEGPASSSSELNRPRSCRRSR